MSGPGVRTVAVVGGGPAGAFCALELARLLPDVTVDLYDREDRGPGAGIVLADEVARQVRAVHPEALRLPESAYATWDETITSIDGERIPSGAFGMSGISRHVFHEHVRTLAARRPNVRLIRRTVTATPEPADLVVLADGAGSVLRQQRAEQFGTSVTAGATRYLWLSTPTVLEPCFLIKEFGPGPLVVHAYPHAAGESTFIVEADPGTLTALGLLDRPAAEAERELATIFRAELGGAPLTARTAGWQAFRTVVNRRWSAGRTVLAGDAAHTVHFSTGSGTALAIDDALCLARSVAAHDDPLDAVAEYDSVRRPIAERMQAEAAESTAWFEQFCRGERLHGHQTVFALRSRRAANTFSRLRERDPEFVARTVARLAGHPTDAEPVDVPLTVGRVRLGHRLVALERRDGRCVLRGADGTQAVGLVVDRTPDGLLPGIDFLAVRARPEGGRVTRSAPAARIRSQSGLPIALLVDEELPRDEANTLIAAARTDLVALP
ncbi:FAD-dependent monooxygenase [Paractinoplanes lichenicola]|uniref:FAD-dependent monooxygenase n=1 Tax=Paractinoplanes lichenicola TaxID=2802976 RepID=A0ABS1VFV6_9ACTN|nr:FAD-dependent monooxygenase [Actinoplanes lichenicola]MBL7253386.1 FAD-dependent monooxygenase [Actinoplanes lichenicola]